MQNQSLPKIINPGKLAEKAAKLQGTLPLADMPRLKNLLTDDAGEVSLSIDFSVDASRLVCMHLVADALLNLECQRCMESFTYPMAINILLSPVKTEADAVKMARYEPLIMEEDTVGLEGIIEDEILLNLPIIPKHTQNECPVVLSEPIVNEAESPFKELLSTFKAKKEE